MGPKKDLKQPSVKRENGGKDSIPSLHDSINSDSWKCVVLMAVERNVPDYFLIKELEEEAASQKRPKIQVISYNEVTKIINDFIKGEIPHRYGFLINYASVFQEAGEYLLTRREIPLELLVKVIKAMLFHLKEESLNRIARGYSASIDPIKIMAERPTSLQNVDKKKETVKRWERGDSSVRVKPPSEGKLQTELLKRGEGVKDTHWINDAPEDAYYNLYVLLIDFRSPEFPLELLKAGIPLHGLICVDTSLDSLPKDVSLTLLKSGSRRLELKAEDILNFWSNFLKLLWDPNIVNFFKNTIFQVYTPRKVQCEKKARGEFIYREMSYLMYDMSSYKQQLDAYLEKLTIRDVEEKDFDMAGSKLLIENLPSECVTVPVVLQFLLDGVCGNEFPIHYAAYSEFGGSYNSATGAVHFKKISSSLVTRFGSHLMEPILSTEMSQREDLHVLSIYTKTKALDAYYGLDEMTFLNEIGLSSSDTTCHYQTINCGPNLQEILNSSGSIFRSLRRRYQSEIEPPEVDYILYSVLMTRVSCPYQTMQSESQSFEPNLKESSEFELIENIEMKRPYFTVTEGSRHVLKSIPYNVKATSKDFFSPETFKIVTPAMLKACSAPDFRVSSPITVQKSFLSDMFPGYEGLTSKKDLFLALGEFVKDDVINKINEFDYLELLTKSTIISKENEIMPKYNCIDHTYSLLLDSVFIAVHKRTDEQNTQHETFNETLRTGVGLRDFYNYILEDETDKFKTQDESPGTKTPRKKYSQMTCLQFTDSDFWLDDSVKDKFWRRRTKTSAQCEEYERHQSEDKSVKRDSRLREENYDKHFSFEAYNVSESIVQYSGLKTVFYSNDCSITAELSEKLYGDQILGVHIAQAGHILHLYSYACPKPHIEEPFTFHVTYRNGVVLAFGRLKSFDKIIKSDIISGGISDGIIEHLKLHPVLSNEGFQFNMSLSLPSGLMVQTLNGMKPCYIRQQILEHPYEERRLFLPNGNLIKIMTNHEIQILKVSGCVITADINEFLNNWSKYQVVDSNGVSMVVENGMIISSMQLQVYQNINVNTSQIFFRRKDGITSVLKYDGSYCVRFVDGTKMCSSLLVEEPLRNYSIIEQESFKSIEDGDKDIEDDYVIINLVIVVEHPEYATTIYNMHNQNWRVLLPAESEITIHPDGTYFVNIDRQTELIVRDKSIRTSRYSTEGELQLQATADLSVFQGSNNVYVSAKDRTGKTFIIEPNSNCYVENDSPSEEEEQEVSTSQTESDSQSTLETSSPSSSQLDKGNELNPENRYFVLKKDMTGFELIHESTIIETLTNLKKGHVVFTQTFPNTGLRCFVLITPELPKSIRKWEVKSILPETKFSPHSSTIMTTTTYGCPPSWMHPFPKRKSIFQIPECFSCRVFLEVKPTGLIPGSSTFDCNFCEVEQIKPKLTLVPLTKMQDYLRKLSNNDQDILREMYLLVAGDIINKPKQELPAPSEKLTHYLQMSKYFLMLEKRDRDLIRNHQIPNFFVCHPAGMSWMILNNHVDALILPEHAPRESYKKISVDTPVVSTPTSESISLSEREYNLSVKTCQSFSDLSYHSSRSGKSAPAFIETRRVCRCKVKPKKASYSYPTIASIGRRNSPLLQELKKIQSPSVQDVVQYPTESDVTSSDNDAIVFPTRVCDFSDNDFDLFNGKSFEREEKNGSLTLGDLMCLGLV